MLQGGVRGVWSLGFHGRLHGSSLNRGRQIAGASGENERSRCGDGIWVNGEGKGREINMRGA